MKGPWIATGAVLAVGCVLVLRQQSGMRALERQWEDLQGEAARQGISLRISGSAARRLRGAEDRNSAHQVRKLEDLLERIEMAEREGGRADAGLRDQAVEAAVGLMDLSPANLRKVLAQLRDNPRLGADTKAGVIGSVLLLASGDHPEEALRLFGESSDLLGKGAVANHLVGSALQSWAERNPSAAMQWVKGNDVPSAGMTREEMQHAVLGGAAKNDPSAAFRLLSELGPDSVDGACEVIASALSDTQRGREDLLKAMRGYVAGIGNESAARRISSAVMEAVGRGVGKNSFEATSQWLDAEGLPESDVASFVQGLSWYSTGSQTGDWLQWMSQRLPADMLVEPVEGLVGDWVQSDYLAAGKWLTALPEGPVKTPAVKAYAEAVAAYDPEVATQWAMTISDAGARMRTLRAIHENWPAGDEAGAARFAAQHGLE